MEGAMSGVAWTVRNSFGAGLTRREFGLLAGAASATFAVGPALAQARRGGVLNIATIGEPPTLDPMDSPADVVGMISQHIFETLYTWGDGWRIRPLLAASDPEISGDGLTYTIRLREGVRFHDGSVMTSTDVLASLNRWMTVAQRGKQTKEYIQSVTAPDQKTIRFSLVKPFAPLLSFLSLQTSAAIVIPAGNQMHPMKDFVGTGPYRLVERMPDRYVQLRRFEEYAAREESSENYGGKRVAYIDELRFVPVPDASTRLQGAIAGQFDYVDALPVENAPQLKGSKADAVILKSFGWPFFFLNAKEGPLSNVALRRAVLAALNFEDMLAAAFGSKEFYSVDGAWYPAGFAMHSNEGAENYIKAGNSEHAKQLARDAGYNGQPIRIMTSRQFDFHFKMAQVAVEYLRAAGFTSDLVVIDWASLLTRRNDPTQYEIFITHGPILPEPTLFSFMTPTAPGWWATPRRDAVIGAFNSEADPTKRAKLWGDVQRAIYEEVPVMRIGNFNMLAARSQRLQGLTPAVWPFFWNTYVAA
jgi:peptide/nickel transport system substrate-binding protein